MTKKHFISLAKFMLATRDGFASKELYAEACRQMANICGMYGARFDRVRFMETCGL